MALWRISFQEIGMADEFAPERGQGQFCFAPDASRNNFWRIRSVP